MHHAESGGIWLVD
jgi:hypothetical protein